MTIFISFSALIAQCKKCLQSLTLDCTCTKVWLNKSSLGMHSFPNQPQPGLPRAAKYRILFLKYLKDVKGELHRLTHRLSAIP